MKAQKSIPFTELEIKGSDKTEHARVSRLFEDIKERSDDHPELLTEHEKNFFCSCLHFAFKHVGKPEDFSFCSNYRFKLLYYTYMFDITGGAAYYKISLEKIREHKQDFLSGKKVELIDVKRKVASAEVWEDLEELYHIADAWDSIIAKSNHQDAILQTVSTETRQQLRELDAAILTTLTKGTIYYRRKRQHILLQSKFVFLVTKEVVETMSSNDKQLKLDGQEIEFNEFGIFHIIMRHYSPGTKPFITGKSFINEDFTPRQLHLSLSNIFSRIEKSKLYSGNSIQKILFKYNNIPYVVWTKIAVKQVPQIGNVQYNRVQSFYPVVEPDELNDLANNYQCLKVDDEIGVYTKK